MKQTNLRAVYKGEPKNDSRKKKVLNLAKETESHNLQNGYLYDLELDTGKNTELIARVKMPENLKLKYDSIHEFLAEWCDINMV